jgi:hypothetical protein
MVMRFAVPQFIDVDDKVVGPLTFKQAAYVVGAGGFALMLITSIGFVWGVVLGTPLYALAGALAFVKINNRPFSLVLFSMLNYAVHKKLYLWKKTEQQIQQVTPLPSETEKDAHTIAHAIQSNTQSRLKELAWALDTQQSTQKDTFDTEYL